MKILCDFDGVICKRNGIPTVMNWKDKPIEGALEAIKLLIEQGHTVKVFTSNPDQYGVKLWLEKHKFPKLEVTNIKEPAHVMIDDRAIRFTDWQDIRKYFA